MELNVIYEDNHLIVCEKPAGVLSQAGSLDLDDMLTIIKKYLRNKYNKPGNVFLGLVHRLDTNVGGVMVFAKTSKAASRLSESIRNRQFKKSYLAVVLGKLVPNKEYELVDLMEKDEVEKKAFFSKNGKEAILRFSCLSNKTNQDQDYSLIDISLETGRFHQIRAQLAKFGYPIFNDSKYGKAESGLEMGLFAYKISFMHPTLKTESSYTLLPATGIFSEFKDEIEIFGGSL